MSIFTIPCPGKSFFWASYYKALGFEGIQFKWDRERGAAVRAAQPAEPGGSGQMAGGRALPGGPGL